MDLLKALDLKIAAVQKELSTLLAARKLLSGSSIKGGDAPFPKAGSTKGTMSAKGRAAIAKAQKARWAKVRAAKKKSA
jgi:hypothetical protein